MHPKFLNFRYKLFQYRSAEQKVANTKKRLLDIGCGDGENMLRFRQPALYKTGLEVSFPRLQTARRHRLEVSQASGTQLPYADNSFDMVYIAHVLHHVENYAGVLSEIRRVLTDDGEVFVVETMTDHVVLRIGRKLHPSWQGDQVEADWTYQQLAGILNDAGFLITETDRYNRLFFLWEILPLAFWPFELFTPLFVYLDLFLAKFLKTQTAHSYFVLRPK